MKPRKKLVAVLLLLSMLLSLWNTGAYAAETVVTTDSELVFDPLAQTAEIAYERHETGYEVSLARAANSVTMRVSSVPAAAQDRDENKARLYIHTGVEPAVGVTYKVSFTLWAERAQETYTVCFDGGSAPETYGSQPGRNIEAGSADRVRYFITPSSGSGELVLRLLLGKTGTEGNTFRFSDLSVERASEAELEIGENILADNLDFNAPGSITAWTNDDSKAELTMGESSATLTVTQAPTNGAEVWKIKLLAATGVMPEAGKAYRLRAEVVSTAAREYEICYNEGNTEKGYDVLYAQKLTGKPQTLERTIYIPTDHTNAGEIVLQLSLGKLAAGESVTLSNLQVEKLTPRFINELSYDFALNKVRHVREYDSGRHEVGMTPIETDLRWDAETAVWESHDGDYAVSLNKTADSATIQITQAPADRGVWKTKLFVRTGVALKAGKTYRVRFDIQGAREQDEYELLLDGAMTADNDRDYGAYTGQKLNAGTETRQFVVAPSDARGELTLVFQLGKTNDTSGNEVTVSALLLEELTPVTKEVLSSSFTYQYSSRVEKAGGNAGELTATETQAKLDYTGSAEGYNAQMIIKTGVIPEANTPYEISFDAKGDAAQDDVSILYGYDGNEDGYARLDGQSLSASAAPFRRTFFVEENQGEILIRLQVGKTAGDNAVTVSNLDIKKLIASEPGDNLATGIVYPSSSYNSDAVSIAADDGYVIALDADSADVLDVTVSSVPTDAGKQNPYNAKVYIHTGVTLERGPEYTVSAEVSGTADGQNFELKYSNKVGDTIIDGYEDGGYRNDGHGEKRGVAYGTFHSGGETVSNTIYAPAAGDLGELILQFDIGGAQANHITIGNISIEQKTSLTELSACTASSRDSATGTANDTDKSLTTLSRKADWETELWLTANVPLKQDHYYAVQTTLTSDKQLSTGSGDDDHSFNLVYSWDGSWDKQYQNFAKTDNPGQYNLEIPADTETEFPAEPEKIYVSSTPGGNFKLVLQLGRTHQDGGTTVTVKDLQIFEINSAGGKNLYTKSFQGSGGSSGSFAAATDPGYTAALTGTADSAVLYFSQAPDSGRNVWNAKLFADTGVSMTAGKGYQVSYRIRSSEEIAYETCYNSDVEKGLGAQYGQTAGTEESAVTFTGYAGDGCDGKNLTIQFSLGNAPTGTAVTLSDIQVKEIAYTDGGSALVESPFQFGSYCSFSKGANEPGYSLTLYGTEDESTLKIIRSGDTTADYKAKLFINPGVNMTAGNTYEVSFRIRGTAAQTYTVFYLDNPSNDGEDRRYAADFAQPIGTDAAVMSKTLAPAQNGPLYLQLSLGDTENDNAVTISGVSVKETSYKSAGSLTDHLRLDVEGAVSYDSSYTAVLRRNAASATLAVTDVPPSDKADWKTKLYIHTGFTPEPEKSYRVSFKIQGTSTQKIFHVLYGYGGGETEKIYGDKYEIPISTSASTVTHDISTNSGTEELTLELLLGLIEGSGNTFTVSNVTIQEIRYETGGRQTGDRYEGTADVDMQTGYMGTLSSTKDSATLEIRRTPAEGMEAWKSKLFITTGVRLDAGRSYRVCVDVLAERDMNYEICYNRDGIEKGYDAIYGLQASAGTVKTVEKVFVAPEYYSGKLVIQLSLGNVPAPNKVTVSNIRVERVSYSSSGQSAMPHPVTYRAPSAITYWAHEDYGVTLSGTDSAITANIASFPEKGAEPWKIKLFVDTGAALQPGKFYKVSACLQTQAAQTFEICYNNGGIERGYDAVDGLRLGTGESQTVEKLLAVPPDAAGAGPLMLQFNLGQTEAANAVTVSRVRVEEVPVTYINVMSQGFSYQGGGAVTQWTYDGCAAALENTPDRATLHITGVPQGGAEVWMVKLFVNTGAVLQAGKTYLVRAELLSAKAQGYEVCFNNEETEKGFDVLYNQSIPANSRTILEKKIAVPAAMTDAGRLVLQFSVGGPAANDFTVSGITVQEMDFGMGGESGAPHTVIDLRQAPKQAADILDVTRQKLSYHMEKISSVGGENAISIQGADLCAGNLYTVSFTARADKNLTGEFALLQNSGTQSAIYQRFTLSPEQKTYTFTSDRPLDKGGFYDLLWQFGSQENQRLGSANVEISDILVSSPPERLTITHNTQGLIVNGEAAQPDAYRVNGSDYYKLRDLAMLLNGTNAQFVIRYNSQSKVISLTAGKQYQPVGGELTVGADQSASCVRSPQSLAINGTAVNLKSYNIGRANYFRLQDLADVLGFRVENSTQDGTASITSPLTPERQEAIHSYDIFFLPEIDGETQPYVGDTMPYYEDGVYYIYYLKEGGDSFNHSVYLTTTTDFVNYTERDDPVLDASREDVQDNWIGTGSVVKAEDTYYFFYTGFTSSPIHEYREKIMVARGTSPTDFEKVQGWEITPPDELGQKNDFRDPQAYYDPETRTISLTVTAAQGGKARILKYTLGADLQDARYDGIIFTDPTGAFWNLECSDTFRIGDKWYLTYSGQEDTVWYAMADDRFGPYTEPTRLEGKLFYAAKHVENGENLYMVGWTRRSETASSTREVSGWGGNLLVQQLKQNPDGTLVLVPVDSIRAAFTHQRSLPSENVSLTGGTERVYQDAFTCEESFLLSGSFTCPASGAFGLAFDFNGDQGQNKLISVHPEENKLTLSFNGDETPISETKVQLTPGKTYSFTYLQDGSVGIFYLDGEASLTVRLYGATGKSIQLFAEESSVTFTSLRQWGRS